jgi:RNA polymerase-binding transcription factor DksA
MQTHESANDTDIKDEADMASAFQMRENAYALSIVVAANRPETHPDFDGESCLECGGEIPGARLALGKIRCVACQGAIERKNKLFAHA